MTTPAQLTPAQELARRMTDAGFQLDGVRGVTAMEFVSELPAPEHERIVARIRFDRHGDGSVSLRPSSVVITHHKVVAVDAAALSAAVPAIAQAPLLAALDPYLQAVTRRHIRSVECALCHLRTADWIVLGGVPYCLTVCAPPP